MHTVPQGFTDEEFVRLSEIVRTATSHLGADVQIHGSRAEGTARPDSDLDIAVRVPSESFSQLLAERFGTPNPGSAKEKTLHHSRRTGKIQAGEAGLRALRKALEVEFGIEMDISIILAGGPFDGGPFLPLAGS